jgi:hypothetical protein
VFPDDELLSLAEMGAALKATGLGARSDSGPPPLQRKAWL